MKEIKIALTLILGLEVEDDADSQECVDTLVQDIEESMGYKFNDVEWEEF